MNIARLFSAYRLLEHELRRERVLRRRDELRHERERKALIDAVQRNANKPPVFSRPEPPKPSAGGPKFLGPTLTAQKQKEQENVIAPRNGHKVEAPTIPSE